MYQIMEGKIHNSFRTKTWKGDKRMDMYIELINDMVGYQLIDIHKMHHFHGSVKIKIENIKFIFFPFV